MLNEYDFDEEVMRESVAAISVPQMNPPIITSRVSTSSQEGIFFDLQKLIEEERLRQQRRIQVLKQKQHTIGQQVSKRLAEKDRKIRELEEEQKRKVYAQCTFKPKTSGKGGSRTFQQFLQQQQDFTKKIEEKKKMLKQNLQAQKQSKSTFHPKTNCRNEQKKKQGTVFDRLYALKDKQNEDDGNMIEVQHFQPKIHEKSKKLARNAPINQLLYQDALRRQQKARGIQSQNHTSFVSSKSLNLNNERYVAQKFIKEYYSVIERLNVPSSTSDKIDYMLFNEILKETGFVQVEEESESSRQRALVHEAYQLLEEFQVNAKNICVFLLALIGVFHINPVNFQEGQQQCPEQELAFDEAEGRKIQKTFDLFKRNRLFSENSRKLAVSEGPAYTFKPQTNKTSEKLAEVHREQMLQEVNEVLEMYPQIDFNIPKDGVITPTDLLVLYNKAKEIKLQCRKDQLDQLEMQNCTFKPSTLHQSRDFASSKYSTGQASLGQKKSLQLYNFHRELQGKKESLRVSRQSQSSAMKECTFAPNLNRKKVQEDKSKYATKQVEEALYRMRKGRQQYQSKKKFLERGEPSTTKNQKFTASVQKFEEEAQQSPILLLDVNLGNKVERLTLYSGDENRLQAVAKQFGAKHELDEESEAKLVQLLHLQMESILAKIPEDEESEDNQ